RTRLEEPSAFPIGEQVEQRVAQLPRSAEPSEVCGRLVEGEEGAGQERVIVGEAPHAGGPIAPRAEQPAVAVPEVLPHEARAADRGVPDGELPRDTLAVGILG